jgi:predicted RNA methylase
MSYSFNSKDEPATDIFFLNEDNKICHASVIMEGAGGSKNAGFIRMLYASKKNIDIDKMKNPSEHLKRKFPKTKKEPVIIKEEKKEKQKKIKVVDDINYQSVKNEIEFMNNFLNSTRKENLKSDRQSEAFKKLLNAIEAYDYYPTPKEYGVKIYNEVLDMYKSGIKKINVLDIGCGLLSLSMPFIENNVKTMLIEENKNWYNVIKPIENLSNVSIVNNDFFDLQTDYYYNKNISVIIMNPPFACPIKDEMRVNNAYLYFIIKAIDILLNNNTKSTRELYVICPKTYFINDDELKMPNSLLKKAFKILDIEDWTETFMPHISHLGDVSGFRTIRKGMPVDMKLTVGLYRLTI